MHIIVISRAKALGWSGKPAEQLLKIWEGGLGWPICTPSLAVSLLPEISRPEIHREGYGVE